MHRNTTRRTGVWTILGMLLLAIPLAAEEMPETPDGAIPSSWLEQVTEQIRTSEYHFSWTEDGRLSAPNRAEDLRTFLDGLGFEVESRTAGSDRFRLRMELTSVGRPGGMVPAAGGVPAADEGRAEIRRPGLTEWFVNDDRGLEHGFTLDAPPAGRGEIVLRLGLAGSLQANPEGNDGRSVELRDASGQAVLRYHGLKVWDATGRELPARIEVTLGAIEIRVDDRDAVYPVTVDPLLGSSSWNDDSDQASAYFGFSVGTAGDVNGDGHSDVIIGAYGWDGGQTDEGKAYVYYGNDTGVDATPAWTVESNQTSAQYGFSVSTAGDVNGDGYHDIAVGARYYDNGQTDEGAVFVYHGFKTGLPLSANRLLDGDQASALFGNKVARAGDVNGDGYDDLLVASYYYDNGHSNEGRVWVFHGSSSGLPTTSAWTAEANQTDALMGISCDGAGDVNGDGYDDVIVGSHLYDGGSTNEGRVWVYHGSASGLSASSNAVREVNQAEARFGFSVSTAGDVNGDGYSDVIVGAYLYDEGQGNEGKVWVWHGSSSGIPNNSAWSAQGNQISGEFGRALGAAGDVDDDGYSDVIIGAAVYDNGQADEGRAWVYRGSGDGLKSSWDHSWQSNQTSAQFGTSVASAGDHGLDRRDQCRREHVRPRGGGGG